MNPASEHPDQTAPRGFQSTIQSDRLWRRTVRSALKATRRRGWPKLDRSIVPRVISRSKWALIGYTIARGYSYSLSRSENPSAGQASLAVDETVAYIHRTYDDYVRYGGLSPEWIRGKAILECGPGDNLGVALRFVASGAASVVALDSRGGRRGGAAERDLYLTLREQLNAEERRRFDRAVDLSGGITFNEHVLTPLYGRSLAELGDLFDSHAFDLIISRAVMQDIRDPCHVLSLMDAALRPGGMMLHKIDLRDYGKFSNNRFHPLEFLTLPDAVYDRIPHSANWPNRRSRCDYYRRKMAEFRYDSNIYITTLTGWDCARSPIEVVPHKTSLLFGADYTRDTLALVQSIRPRLARRFRHIPDHDLMVAGILLAARKPATSASQDRARDHRSS